MGSTVLVTGVSRTLGADVAVALSAEPGVQRVVAVDAAAPASDLRDTEFMRADLRNPLLGRIVADGVDTVVHLGLSADERAGTDRASQKENNVIGSMQLLAACQAQPRLRRIVLGSTAAVYGCSAADPAHFPEDWPVSAPRSGYTKDVVEVEQLVRGVGHRRPDVSTCVVRFTHLLGPSVDSPLTTYLRAPVVPVPFGYEARLQLLHEDDATQAVVLAALGTVGGIVNVAADGVITLAQGLRLLGHLGVPVPMTSGRLLSVLTRRTGLGRLADDHPDFLRWGRALDTARMRADLGLAPRWSTRSAFADFATGAAASASGRHGPVPAAPRGRIR